MYHDRIRRQFNPLLKKTKKKIACLGKISKSVETIDSLNIHFQRNSVLPSQVLPVNLSQFWQIFLLQQPAYLHNIEEQLHGLQHSRWFFGSFLRLWSVTTKLFSHQQFVSWWAVITVWILMNFVSRLVKFRRIHFKDSHSTKIRWFWYM